MTQSGSTAGKSRRGPYLPAVLGYKGAHSLKIHRNLFCMSNGKKLNIVVRTQVMRTHIAPYDILF